MTLPDPTTTIRITPTGVLAAAFSKLEQDANDGGWWKRSPLLSAVGLAHHLDESGWEIRRKRNGRPR